MSLAQSTLPPSADSRAVVSTVRRDGIAILPGFLSGTLLERLNGEFDEIIETRATLGFTVTDREEGLTVALVRNRLPGGRFPATAEAFAAVFMSEVARSYFDAAPLALNHQVYVNLNRGTFKPVPALPFLPHMDKIHTLKFFIYLTDTTEANGAMGVVPGSQVENREHRLECMKTNADFRAVRNVVGGVDPFPVEGPAGTLFVFDTDVTHNAGHVQAGLERRIMRGHSRTIAELKTLRLEREAVGVEA